MIGKRFKLKYVIEEPFQKRRIYDEMAQKEYDCTMKHQEDLCDLLNELYDENQELVKENYNLDARNMDLEQRLRRCYGND